MLQAVGIISRSKQGFLVDVASVHVDYVLERTKRMGQNDIIDLGYSSADGGEMDSEGRTWVPLFTLDKIPRLYTQNTDKPAFGRKLPWAKMKCVNWNSF